MMQCAKPASELTFNSIVHGLFNEPGAIPAGDIFDAGAQDGTWACMYACQQPKRTIRAVDPSARLVAHIACKSLRPNLKGYVAAISNETGWLDRNAVAASDQSAFAALDGGVGSLERLRHRVVASTRKAHAARNHDGVAVSTIDDLVAGWGGAPLGFAHLDLEGNELLAVLGMRRVIRRDRPVISVEVGAAQPSASELVALLASLEYTSFVVQEQCGVRFDCRNLLAFPDERLPALLTSPTLDLAARASLIAYVNATSVRYYAGLRERTATNVWGCQNRWFCINLFANWVPRTVGGSRAEYTNAMPRTPPSPVTRARR